MGWTFSRKEGKFRIWSSIVDKFITPWMSRDLTIRFLDRHYMTEAKLKTIEAFYSFPYMMGDHDDMGHRYINDPKGKKGRTAYFKWLETTYDNYAEAVETKYQEVMEQLTKGKIDEQQA